ncbi:MAG TPA: GAF domain-containing SpoIIE family protein phosphatase [Terriglobales bacterium]
MGTSPIRSRPQLQSLFTLSRATQRFNSILDVERLLDTVVDEVARTFHCPQTCIFLKEHDSDDLVLAAVFGESCSKGDRFRIGRDGMVGQAAMLRQTYYERDVSSNLFYLGAHKSGSELDIPILSGNDLLGVLSMEREEADAFSNADIELLEELVAHLAVALRNSYIYSEEKTALSLMEEAEEEARLMQQYMFPKSAPQVPGFRIEGDCMPAGRISGDWYDFIPLSEGRIGIVLADVCGKGMAAALLMSTARGVLRTLAPQIDSPAELMSQLNLRLLEDTPAGKYVTMIYGVLDPDLGTWTYANAGHPETLLVQDGDFHWLTTEKGLPLGLMHSEYDESTVEIKPASTLVLYSDGVTEAASREDVQFGCLPLAAQARLGHICSSGILEQVREFRGSGSLVDDATVVVIRRLPHAYEDMQKGRESSLPFETAEPSWMATGD